MAEAIHDGAQSAARTLSRLFETFHSVTYYSPEILRLTDEGFRGWWHAYFAYRPAPMGAVSSGSVTAAFYNFAPRMVERAVPGVWDIMSPTEITARRLELVDEALTRSLDADIEGPAIARAADLIRDVVDGCQVAGRPVCSGYAGLDWPDDPHLALWHGCTLLREYRGDNHNLALAAADVDGVECHVLMTAHGHGNMATILAIRGWNETEWGAAVASLAARGWLTASGEHTAEGRRARSDIERRTDEMTAGALASVGQEGLAELERTLAPLVDHLISTGEVSGRWPPPTVMR